MKVAVVIPARGGSKGIPRKNLRPVGGKPLIYHSIKAALGATLVDKVVVTTDDEEIALLASRFGAEIIMRKSDLAEDQVPLDPVICRAVDDIETGFSCKLGVVVTVQPTSPLVTSADIDAAIEKLSSAKCQTVVSVVDDRHLNWGLVDNKPVPLYERRVNRQMLPPQFKETGAVIACTREQIRSGTRIGRNISILEVPQERSFDIDTLSDLYLCDAILNKRKIVFVIVGYAEVGLGHAYRALTLANELVSYDISFVCESRSMLAADYIRGFNFNVVLAEKGHAQLADVVLAEQPDLIINDILDTSITYMARLKHGQVPIVNFEDLGPGADEADLVINALYGGVSVDPRVLIGTEYFCLRDEFLFVGSTGPRSEHIKILVTFGGVDEWNITLYALREIVNCPGLPQLDIDVVLGPGYRHRENLTAFLAENKSERIFINVVEATSRISEYMLNADLAVTSGGRTVLELAALTIPMIVVCQNERETTHTYASHENGVLNLGLFNDLTHGQFASSFSNLVENENKRLEMKQRMEALDLTGGKYRVISKIKKLIV